MLLGILLHQAAARPDWFRTRPPLGGAGWVVLSFIMLSVDAVVVTLASPGVNVLVAGAAGVFNSFAWYGLVTEVVCREQPHGRGFLQGTLAGVAGLLVAWGAAFYVATRNDSASLHAVATAHAAAGGKPVIGVSGFRSSSPKAGGGSAFPYLQPYRFQPFSYRGLAPDGTPLPYGPTDTYLSLQDSDRLLDAQCAGVRWKAAAP